MDKTHLIFERVENVASLSNFNCGYTPIDSFMTKKKGLKDM